MIDKFGVWTEEQDYKTYPKSKWCDMDYVANYIKEEGYAPKTTMENLVEIVIHQFLCKSEFHPAYADNLMINIPNLAAFVEASGGLEEFDYGC